MKISAITLASHDAEYLPDSITRYYPYVDEIVIGLDKNRQTWTGNKFTFNEDKVFSQLKALDVEGKINLVEESFCIPELVSVPIENDNYERNILRSNCSNDIILSIDADEILYNCKDFFERYVPLVAPYLKKYDVCFHWVTPYKIIGDVVLLIGNEYNQAVLESQAVLSHKTNPFMYARYSCVSATGSNRLTSPLIALHYGLARKNEESLKQKITNQGHSNEDDGQFLEVWKQINLQNFQSLQNFKPSHIGGPPWDKLLPIKKDKLNEYCNSIDLLGGPISFG